MESLSALIDELEIMDPRDVRLTLYSMRFSDYLYSKHFMPSCENHRQEQEHELTRAYFQQALNIPDENIQDVLYKSSYADGALGSFQFLDAREL